MLHDCQRSEPKVDTYKGWRCVMTFAAPSVAFFCVSVVPRLEGGKIVVPSGSQQEVE